MPTLKLMLDQGFYIHSDPLVHLCLENPKKVFINLINASNAMQ